MPIPLTPDVPTELTTPPGVPSDDTLWFDYGERPADADDDRLAYALFSGGDDSLVMTHRCMTEGRTDAVLYLNTNSGLAGNLDYVKGVCREFGWPLRVERAPVSLVEMGMKYGFPGTKFHSIAYAYFKERQLSRVAGEFEGPPDYYTGVYKAESDRRMENVGGENRRAEGKNGRWYWVRPINGWDVDDVADYRERHGLPRNPVAAEIHRSGDCYCGAFAHRDELLVDLRAKGYDAHADWLHDVEAAVQEYRGRVAAFRDANPEGFAVVDAYRDRFNPKPMRLPAARHLYPVEAALADELPAEQARTRGQQDKRNYWGHGKLANSELQALLAENDPEQMELCEFCSA